MSTDWMKTVPEGIAKPQALARPVAKRAAPSGWAPSDRKLGFFTAKRARETQPSGPPKPKYYDPTGRKLQTSPSAFPINIDSVVTNPLRRTKKAGRGRRKGKLTRHKARASYSQKASRPSTRGYLRR